ncbi:MAG: exodeoxyribonuclease VII small subunit [Candidatus Marinimicrobia bacterium]|jgi:exodeoxyribonuclease VII small subunit|nr:exodeoxyribonuclease VII small subunit [Candidatus Neomarinimicrobiota bacterium]MDP6456379.1 exodeoxyribonuclease VII small subunit [Candidatus Neomarinimicrobiota bacterium]MDP6593677.1 exodeoxyribonuclease VII small subunit [Candidatus Neomarinimicrobiota bacterium]MDP6836227.1 exodeoxyribonuclease VII small subunit [Candidatus Neomarinimicrobiota bacterium]MDP6966365.1 exodeoxyribonuclease VII small subunit [Candidatus Neomarinimicrobiota bacterium]|tara:strand:- start:225 stop:452 length:228 start_codon:yes stop_codon:yes gene_type:complete
MAKKSDMSFEQAMTRLEEIVKQLEDSAISIEESLALFEEGTELTKMCRSRLEEAEKKIIVLTQNEGDGDDSELES